MSAIHRDNLQPDPLPPNGRDSRGRFAAGNRAAKGNPHARAVAELRNAMLASVTAGDVEMIIATLVAAAKSGDTVAAREVLDRTIGKPVASDVLARLEALEEAIGGKA